jgi:hypothetical protein
MVLNISKNNFLDSLNKVCIWTIKWSRYMLYSRNLENCFLLVFKTGGSNYLRENWGSILCRKKVQEFCLSDSKLLGDMFGEDL